MANIFKIFFLAEVVTALLDIHQEEKKFDWMLQRFTSQVISKYFWKFRCVTYVTEENEIEIEIPEREFISVFLIKLKGQEEAENKLLTESFEQGCGGHVIRVKSAKRSSVIE